MKTSGIEASMLSGELDKFVIAGLNRFVFLCDPSDYSILYRGGALNERVVSGDDRLSSILSANSVSRLEALTRSVRGAHFTYGLEFRLLSGQAVGSYGSLKRVFFDKKELILGVFYFGVDTGAVPVFRPGDSMDITRQRYWVGNMDRTFFSNEKLQKAFDSVPGASHLLDLCVAEDRPVLAASLQRVLAGNTDQAEYTQVAFRFAGEGVQIFQLRMVPGPFAGRKVVRVVFLETDSWIFQLEMDMYHRRLEMAAGRYAAEFVRESTLEKALARILADAGQLLNTSRGFIHQYYPELGRVSMTREWSAPGVEQVRLLSTYPVENVKKFVDLMSQGEPIVVHAKEEVIKAFKWMAAPHISRSFILFPLHKEGESFPFIGFGEVRFERFWTYGEQQFVGKLAETVGLLMDRARLFDSLKKEKTRAEEANLVKEKFLATISHEVRNPLNAIIGLSQMLLEQGAGKENPNHEQALEFIQSSGRKLSGIMENVLYLSKLKLYDQSPDLQPVNLNNLMGELESYLMGRVYGKKSLKGSVHCTGLPQSLVTDREFLLRILMNLMDNAVKFTEAGTVVLSVESDGEHIYFCVTDTGIGIEADELKKIFDEFYQVERLNIRAHDGVGAGLAIVKKMAEAIGAEITVDAAPGKGSSFTVRVPIGEEKK